MRVIILKKRWIILSLGLIFVFCAAFAPPETEVFAPAKATLTVVVDAGHGGEDGGAVALDGTKESGVNLSIAKKLSELLIFMGTETKMTRQEDVSIHDEAAETLRQKKVSDLKNRVAIVNGTTGAVLISIHQNSLPSDTSVHGAQAFYNTEGQGMAEEIQHALNAAINGAREKQAKAAPDGVYLMKNAAVSAVLVECGFLSNAEETALLQTENHQKKLAASIAAGYLNTP